MLADTKKVYAFIDEYGNSALSLDKEGTSSFYIIVAIIIDEKQKEILDDKLKDIQKKYFGESEIKSSRLGKIDEKRIKILSAVADFSFSWMALVVDKSQIDDSSGLKFKRSFYKYLTRQFYYHVGLDKINNLHVFADKIGTDDFMAGYKTYLTNHLSLFEQKPAFDFMDSKDSVHIQLADLIAGTLARIYDPKLKSENSIQFYKLLSRQMISIHGWPLRFSKFQRALLQQPQNLRDDSKWDDQIERMVLIKVRQYEMQYSDSEEELNQMRIVVLRYLLFYSGINDNPQKRYIVADILRQRLVKEGFVEAEDMNRFYTKIIAPLRDAGIIIAGSSKGYKLAICYKDICEYLNHDTNLILPMMNRLQIARSVVKHATTSQLDILNKYNALQQLVDVFEANKYKIDTKVIHEPDLEEDEK
jgi:hypothetical protein